MTDAMMFLLLGLIALCALVIWMLRYRNYEDRHILETGFHRVGKDIPPGRCDIVAESGGGSFIIKNKKAECWNLGNSIGVTSAMMPGSFRNVTLMRGDILEIDGNVRVLLTPPTPIRNIKKETLGPGIYRFGVEGGIPPAKYDFEAVSGSGEIILVDIQANAFDLFQDMAAGHPQRAKKFDNVVCSRRYELWINGSLQVKLKRSEHQYLFIGSKKAT